MNLNNEYKSLSNFYNAKITYKGIEYQNNVSAFCAQFFEAEAQKKAFSNVIPAKAMQMVKRASIELSEEEQLEIMHDICLEKMKAHKDIKELLMSTNEEIVNEVTWNDTFWGIYNGEGENHTGKILEQIRDELNTKKKKSKKEKEKKEKLEEVITELKEDGLDGEENQ